MTDETVQDPAAHQPDSTDSGQADVAAAAPAVETASSREETIIEAWFKAHVEPLLDIGTPLRALMHRAKDELKKLF